MRFLIDENVPLLVVTALRSIGHDCFAVDESDPQAVDADILAQARREQRVLVTFDSDFGRLIYQDLAPPPPGVMYVRSRPEHATFVAEYFLTLFRDDAINPMSRYLIIEPGAPVRSLPLE